MTGEGGGGVVFLKPGEIVVSSVPLQVTTLLGSCVAVTMHSPRHGVGAICHAQLPCCRKGVAVGQDHPDAGKFVNFAILRMLDRLAGLGVCREEIQAKLFGGADMFDAHGRRGVGRQNSEMALKVLEKESVRVVKQDLGGERGRKIIFRSHTGEVLLKRLRKTEQSR